MFWNCNFTLMYKELSVISKFLYFVTLLLNCYAGIKLLTTVYYITDISRRKFKLFDELAFSRHKIGVPICQDYWSIDRKQSCFLLRHFEKLHMQCFGVFWSLYLNLVLFSFTKHPEFAVSCILSTLFSQFLVQILQLFNIISLIRILLQMLQSDGEFRRSFLKVLSNLIEWSISY